MKDQRPNPSLFLQARTIRLESRLPWIEPLENRLLFSAYTVTTLGDGAGAITPNGIGKFNATTLRAAITAANAHAGADTVNFAAGLMGAINLGSALPGCVDVLAIEGPGATKLTVQRRSSAQFDFSILTIADAATVALSGLTIAKGTGTGIHEDAGFAGGVANSGKLSIRACVFQNNGPGVWFPDLEGGAIANLGELSVSDSDFVGNSALKGSAIYNGGLLTVSRCNFSGNTSRRAGAIDNQGTMTAIDSRFTENTTTSQGYTGAAIENEKSVTLVRCAFTNHGSLPVGNSGTLVIDGSTFSDNAGVGIYNSGTLTVTASTFVNNLGAGVLVEGATPGTLASISGSTFIGNQDSGLSIRSGAATVTGCLFKGNIAFNGGGINNGGSLFLSNSTLVGNQVWAEDHADGFAGGIFNGGSMNVVNSTLVDNVSGGICNLAGTATLINTIVVGSTYFGDVSNMARGTGRYGRITAASGGNMIGELTLGAVVSNDMYSMLSFKQVPSLPNLVHGQNGNRIGVTPAQLKLGPLANNGGPTQTMVLLPGSIAINAGSNAKALDAAGKPLATDQRGTGFARIVGGTVDVGAFEVQSPVITGKGSVAGVVYKDLNGNRIQDANETGVKGWLVWADLNKDGKLNYNEPRTVSNAAGKYTLANVPAGYQLVRLEHRASWQQTIPRGGGAQGPTIVTDKLITGWHFGIKPILG